MMRHCLFSLLFAFSSLHACTAFQVQAEDRSWIYCRSLEFGYALDSSLLIVPRGSKFMGTSPNQKGGLPWKVKYGYVGMNQSVVPTTVSDGMNEKGLVVGCLYLPLYAKYQDPKEAPANKMLGVWELASFLLGSCATVEDVKEMLPTVWVAEQSTPGFGTFVIPLHFYVSDARGNAMVIEYIGGERILYDNPLKILTNSPPFDWHMTNLTNYAKLSPYNFPTLQIGPWKEINPSQGTGALGLPGDLTAPSRFVRAALYSHWASPKKTAEEAVLVGFHILNTFDIFEGAVQDAPGAAKRSPFKMTGDTTEWVVVHDQTNLKTYFRTYQSLAIQRVDLNRIDFSKPGFSYIPLKKTFQVEDVTEQKRGMPLLSDAKELLHKEKRAAAEHLDAD